MVRQVSPNDQLEQSNISLSWSFQIYLGGKRGARAEEILHQSPLQPPHHGQVLVQPAGRDCPPILFTILDLLMCRSEPNCSCESWPLKRWGGGRSLPRRGRRNPTSSFLLFSPGFLRPCILTSEPYGLPLLPQSASIAEKSIA